MQPQVVVFSHRRNLPHLENLLFIPAFWMTQERRAG
jgi:hypothetical protein